MACSADGLVKCACKGRLHKDHLIEIICPYSLRLLSPKEAAKQHGCEIDLRSSKWTLCEQSEYYFQIQCQLFVYKLDVCDLVIYTMQGIHVVSVLYNESFARGAVHLASDFYKHQVVPRLLYDTDGLEWMKRSAE